MTEPALPPPETSDKPKPDARAAQRLLTLAIALIVIGGGGLLAWDRMRQRNDVVVRSLPAQSPRPAPSTIAPPVEAPPPAPPSVPATPPEPPARQEAPAPQAAPTPPAPAADNGDVAARLADIERRLAQAQAPAQPAPNPAEVQLAQREAQIAQLEARIAALENSVAAERTRADRAERASRAAGDRLALTVRAAAALGRLRTALERGMPFEREYDESYAVLAGNDAAVARLQPLRQWAESGIPTRAELREALDSQGSEIIRAAMIEDSGSWWQALLARLKALVIVRPTPDSDVPAADADGGDTPAAVVARAEARVRDGDVPNAIAEMTTLTGGAADTALAWVAAARARVAADEAGAALDDLLQRFAGAGASVPAPASPPDSEAP